MELESHNTVDIFRYGAVVKATYTRLTDQLDQIDHLDHVDPLRSALPIWGQSSWDKIMIHVYVAAVVQLQVTGLGPTFHVSGPPCERSFMQVSPSDLFAKFWSLVVQDAVTSNLMRDTMRPASAHSRIVLPTRRRVWIPKPRRVSTATYGYK